MKKSVLTIFLIAIAITGIHAQTTLNINAGAGPSIDHNGPVSRRDPSYLLAAELSTFNGWFRFGPEFKNVRYRPMVDSMRLLNIASLEFTLGVGLPNELDRDFNHFAGTGFGFGCGPAWSSERYEHGVITGMCYIKICYGWELDDGLLLSLFFREAYHQAWMVHTYPTWTTTSIFGATGTFGYSD